MLLRLAYLSVTNAFALLRLLPMSDRDVNAHVIRFWHGNSEAVTERADRQARLRMRQRSKSSLARPNMVLFNIFTRLT